MMPNFLLIGAGKAGTTSIHHYLQQHPQIYMCPQKETNFFVFQGQKLNFQGPDDISIVNSNSITELSAYQQLFDGVDSEIAVGEASPKYLSCASQAAPRIRKYIPDAKLIAILRNPVERAFSSYLMQVRDGRETLSFAEAIAQESTRIEQNWAWGHYTKVGFYAQHLKHYFQYFASNQIQIYLYEDLQDNAQKLLQNIFQFLEIDTSFQPNLKLRYNVSGVAQNQILHRGVTEFNNFAIGNSAIKRNLKRMLPNSWVRRFNNRYEQVRSFYFQRNLTKPQISPDLYLQLRAVFQEDILHLQDTIGRDLSHWLEPIQQHK